MIDLHAISIRHAEQAGDAEWAAAQPARRQAANQSHPSERGRQRRRRRHGGRGALDRRFRTARYAKVQGGGGAAGPNSVLWYRAPAASWNEALPVGNGRLGAMVFGGVAQERLQLNEDTLWAGGPNDPVNPEAPKALPRCGGCLRRAVTEAEALADARQSMAQPSRRCRLPDRSATSCSTIQHAAVHGLSARARSRRRRSRACGYTPDGVRFTREVFASRRSTGDRRAPHGRPAGRDHVRAQCRRRSAARRRASEATDTLVLEGAGDCRRTRRWPARCASKPGVALRERRARVVGRTASRVQRGRRTS